MLLRAAVGTPRLKNRAADRMYIAARFLLLWVSCMNQIRAPLPRDTGLISRRIKGG